MNIINRILYRNFDNQFLISTVNSRTIQNMNSARQVAELAEITSISCFNSALLAKLYIYIYHYNNEAKLKHQKEVANGYN